MYDKLIKQLRSAANPKREFDNELFLEDIAADAIEDLQKQLQKSEEDNINLTGWLAEEHAKHLWVPVTERLPDYMKNVLVTDGVSSGMGWRDYYEEPKEDYWISPYANVNDLCITHWMPLPEPPKEE